MKSMFDKLGLYDLLGYIIPGMIGIFAVRVLYEEILKKLFPIKLDSGFIDSIVFLVLSYFVGIIIHELSNIVQEVFLKKLWGGFFSEKFLLEGDKQCSDEEKETYYKLAEDVFQIVGPYDKNKSHLVYLRFRTALQVAGKDEKSQLFNTYYGMYRNFSTGALLCSIVYFIYVLVFIIALSTYKIRITDDYSLFLTFAISIAVTLLLFRRTKRFGELHVSYVFRCYYEYFRTCQ